jgi:predicted TIM-barrel fold metal-dependent hydrolase
MTTITGAIDCDIHPAVSTVKTLLPYLEEYWADAFVSRGQDGFDQASFPANAPINCRPDFRPPSGLPGSDFGLLQKQALDSRHARFGILNCLYGGQLAVSESMAAALCRAVNDWIAKEWLARDPRLRASIVVPPQSPDLAAEEIERLAPDRRFVQVILPVAAEMMLGKRFYWPIYEAAVRHHLPVGLYAGSMHRYAPTPSGWPSHYLQDYCGLTQSFEAQLLNLIHQGVFGTFPDLKVVLLESGVTWLPGFMWRALKSWRSLRPEVPWVRESPIDIVRRQVRLTVQPFDAPPSAEQLERVIEQIGSDDMLLFASDYPHWHFDGDAVLPQGFPARLIEKVAVENPLKTYPRLGVTVQ